MYYPCSITIVSDGKSVMAVDNKTGKQVSLSYNGDEDLNDYELVYKAATAMEKLFEFYKQQNNDEIKVGDRVQFTDKFDTSSVYQYATEFVDKLDIPSVLKTRYCYSVSHPPLNDKYIVHGVANNKAYIETLTGWGRCFVVDTKILKKVNE